MLYYTKLYKYSSSQPELDSRLAATVDNWTPARCNNHVSYPLSNMNEWQIYKHKNITEQSKIKCCKQIFESDNNKERDDNLNRNSLLSNTNYGFSSSRWPVDITQRISSDCLIRRFMAKAFVISVGEDFDKIWNERVLHKYLIGHIWKRL